MKGTESDDLLVRWFAAAKPIFDKHGISAQYIGSRRCVDIDGADFVGTITHWAPRTFEFHFVEVATQNVVCIETHELDSVAAVTQKLNEVIADWRADRKPK